VHLSPHAHDEQHRAVHLERTSHGVGRVNELTEPPNLHAQVGSGGSAWSFSRRAASHRVFTPRLHTTSSHRVITPRLHTASSHRVFTRPFPRAGWFNTASSHAHFHARVNPSSHRVFTPRLHTASSHFTRRLVLEVPPGPFQGGPLRVALRAVSAHLRAQRDFVERRAPNTG